MLIQQNKFWISNRSWVAELVCTATFKILSLPDSAQNFLPNDHNISLNSLIQLHWLPIRWRVQYKLVMLMYGLSSERVLSTCKLSSNQLCHHFQGFVRQRALRRSSSYRIYAPSSVNVPSASPARLHGTHCLPTPSARRTDKLSKHYWNLISSVKLLIFHSYCWLFTVRRSCPYSNGRPTNLHWDDDDDDPTAAEVIAALPRETVMSQLLASFWSKRTVKLYCYWSELKFAKFDWCKGQRECSEVFETSISGSNTGISK